MSSSGRGWSAPVVAILGSLVAMAGWVVYESIPRPVAAIAPKAEPGPVKVRLLSPESKSVADDAGQSDRPDGTAVETDAAPKPPVADAGRWEEEVARYEAADRESPPGGGGVVFVGSSNIRMWDTLAEDFPGVAVVNRGVGGCTLAELARFAPRLIDVHRPDVIVVSAGTNDLNDGAAPEDVLAAFRALLETCHRDHPQATVVMLGALPAKSRWEQRDRQLRTNDLLRAATAAASAGGSKVEFIDLGGAFLGADGLPDPAAFLDDDLHPSREGNARRAAELRPVIERCLRRAAPAA